MGSPTSRVGGSRLVTVLVPVCDAPDDPDKITMPPGATYADVAQLVAGGHEFVSEIEVAEGYLIVLRASS